jgi:hypothetical protein
MDRTCSMHGGKGNYFHGFIGKTLKREATMKTQMHVGYAKIELTVSGWGMWTGLICFRTETCGRLL